MNELLKPSLKAISAAKNDFETEFKRAKRARKRVEIAKRGMA